MPGQSFNYPLQPVSDGFVPFDYLVAVNSGKSGRESGKNTAHPDTRLNGSGSIAHDQFAQLSRPSAASNRTAKSTISKPSKTVPNSATTYHNKTSNPFDELDFIQKAQP